MIYALGINKIKLLSNSEKIKRVGMSGYGLEIVDYEKFKKTSLTAITNTILALPLLLFLPLF